jgi:hypothetical protein
LPLSIVTLRLRCVGDEGAEDEDVRDKGLGCE